MNQGALMSPEEAAPKVAEVFVAGDRCSLAAREDRAFPNGWLPLGDVSLASTYPPGDPPTVEGLGACAAEPFQKVLVGIDHKKQR